MHNIGAKVMFIEVYNEDEQFLASHYRSTVGLRDTWAKVGE